MPPSELLKILTSAPFSFTVTSRINSKKKSPCPSPQNKDGLIIRHPKFILNTLQSKTMHTTALTK